MTGLWIDPATAGVLEQEIGLPAGYLASDREGTEAERIYLSVPALPLLAIHVDYLPMNLALLIYEQDYPGVETRPVGHEAGALKGAAFSDPGDVTNDIKRQWAGLTIARQGGLTKMLEEDLAVTVTGWVNTEPGRRWSWSIAPKSVRNIFAGASRSILLGPMLADVPPPEDGDPSPGKCIDTLSVQSVIRIHSILYQGVSSLQHYDGGGLMQLSATRLAANA